MDKDGILLGPIDRSTNSGTYDLAKTLATILATLLGNTPHHINNSTDFTGKIIDLKLVRRCPRIPL